MDLLEDLLRSLDLDSELYFRARLRGPIAVRVPAREDHIRFHMVVEGRCEIRADAEGGTGARLALGPGDLVLVPHGAAHGIASGVGSGERSLDALLAEARWESEHEISWGSGEPLLRLVCGHFACRAPRARGAPDLHPVLRSLPALLHVPAREGRRFAWIDSLLAHLEGERRGDRAGSREIVRRLSEIVLIEVLRASPECGPSSGALVALSDPVVRRALEAIHAGPERRWTLETLSARAGASRSVLAERFRAALGTSPMRYASRWRLERARGLLERRDLSVGEVALAVGYRSEAAFNRAFKEAYGAPPGRLRRLASQDASNTSQGTATIGSS